MYYGGGFVVEFGNDLEADLEMIQFLEENMWLDQLTRAVFLEFAVYNPVSNVHIFGMNLVEFQSVGGKYTFGLRSPWILYRIKELANNSQDKWQVNLQFIIETSSEN